MIAVLTAKTWGVKTPYDYVTGPFLQLAIDYECAKLLSEYEENQAKERERQGNR